MKTPEYSVIPFYPGWVCARLTNDKKMDSYNICAAKFNDRKILRVVPVDFISTLD